MTSRTLVERRKEDSSGYESRVTITTFKEEMGWRVEMRRQNRRRDLLLRTSESLLDEAVTLFIATADEPALESVLTLYGRLGVDLSI